MVLTVEVDFARDDCLASIDALLRAVDGFDEYALLGASRCHGWTRMDVVVHVIGGWQEMLQGLVSVFDAQPTVDAATYWPAFTAAYGSGDPVSALVGQRRRTSAYERPRAATAHLHEVAEAVRRGIGSCPDLPHQWDGHVFTAGDFLSIWTVEHVVHHLDLLTDDPPPRAGLALARATVEALVGEPLPGSWSDLDATLVGTGRAPVPHDATHLADRLPALG